MAVPSPARYLGWLAVSGFVLVVLRRGWMCDDAFITMRAVDNLIHGRGFVYNAGERVLGFTNPLWALLLALPYAVFRDAFLTPVVAGVLVSAAFGSLLVFRVARDARVGALVLGALCFSRGFVDFSTGGLENALTHLLLLVLLASLFEAPPQKSPRAVLKVLVVAALLMVDRIDSAPLIAPPVAWFLWRERAQMRPKTILLGLAPALAWFAFAGVYYGFFLPNTAYAKLNARIPRGEMVRQGLAYVFETLDKDPGTAILIVLAGLVLVAVGGRRSARDAWTRGLARAIGAGIVLDVLYVISIGGDFMSGRFLTSTLAVSAIVLGRYGSDWLVDDRRLRVGAALAAFVALALPFSPFHRDPADKPTFTSHKILDERAFYVSDFGLAENLRYKQWQKGLFADGRAVRRHGERVVVFNNVGTYAFGAGPSVHVIDELALTDPLLARMPFEYDDGWRPGHLVRKLPDGYEDSVASGENLIKDACIHDYYDKLHRIVSGPLFTAERFAAIIALNLPGGAIVRPCPSRRARR